MTVIPSESTSFISPLLPTWLRYRTLFPSREFRSILRVLQYEALSRHFLGSKVIDLGGGNKVDYRQLIKCDEYYSVNIDARMDPSHLVKVGQMAAFSEDEFDTVLCMNTVEHIYEPINLLASVTAALKKGGLFLASTPFMFRVHGSPEDFFRPSPDWWIKTLVKLGYTNICVEPLLWGPFSTGVVCSGLPGPGKKIRTHFCLMLDILYRRLRYPNARIRFSETSQIKNSALGYFVSAVKI